MLKKNKLLRFWLSLTSMDESTCKSAIYHFYPYQKNLCGTYIFKE